MLQPNQNNKVYLRGRLTDVAFSHDFGVISYHKGILEVERTSGNMDRLPVMLTSRMLNKLNLNADQTFVGEIRTYKIKQPNDIAVHKPYIYILTVEENDYTKNNNIVELSGKMYRSADIRTTPSGKSIVDFNISVPRVSEGIYDKIYAIAWGDLAEYLTSQPHLQFVKVTGRYQSREYVKKLEDNAYDVRTTYELSLSKIKRCKEEDCLP